jgi:hypothetical protein
MSAITEQRGCNMAGHGETNGEAGAMDISAHRASYEGFLGWFKWGAIASFIVAAVVVIIIA